MNSRRSTTADNHPFAIQNTLSPMVQSVRRPDYGGRTWKRIGSMHPQMYQATHIHSTKLKMAWPRLMEIDRRQPRRGRAQFILSVWVLSCRFLDFDRNSCKIDYVILIWEPIYEPRLASVEPIADEIPTPLDRKCPWRTRVDE